MSRNLEDPFLDLDAERAVIGSLIEDPARIPEYGELHPDYLFGLREHQLFAEAILAVHHSQRQVNGISVCQWLKDRPSKNKQGTLLAEAGGMGVLHLCDPLLSPKSTEEQLARLRDLAIRRNARLRLHRAKDALYDMTRPAEELVLDAAGQLAALGQVQVTGFRTAREFLERELEKVDDTQKGKAAKYVLTGLRIWDELLSGLPLGELTIIAAQPGVGKSSVGASMAHSIADGDADRIPEECAIFSLEDAGGWMPRRLLAQGAEVSIRELLRKGLDAERLDRVWDAGARLGAAGGALDRIFINDERGMTAHRVSAAARQLLARRPGLRVVFVDHLLEMVDFTDTRNLDQRIGEILRVLRDLAVQCNVAVVLFAHLKDPDDSYVDARHIRPKIQDFAGGRAVDRMARAAVGLWFPPMPPEPKPGKEPVEPKVPAKATDEQREQIAQKHAHARLAWSNDYQRARADWETRCGQVANTLACTVLKATEGESGMDFGLERVRHAGLVSRTGGMKNVGDLGFTPARRR